MFSVKKSVTRRLRTGKLAGQGMCTRACVHDLVFMRVCLLLSTCMETCSDNLDAAY